MLDFPNAPTNGQVFTFKGQSWLYDGTKWLPNGLSTTAVLAMNDNRIINGDMRIDQRNNGANGSTQGYTADRWLFSSTQVNKFYWQRGAGPLGFGFPYSITLTSASAFTPAATDYFVFRQVIEADMLNDFAWGTAAAQPVTLSFVAFSTLGGIFSGSLVNDTGTRSYPFSFTLSASAWTKVVVNIPGDTSGTWVLIGNGKGLYVSFDLGSGANFRGPAGAWVSANYTGVTGAVSIVATNAASWLITGVKLEIGSVATPFNRQSLAKSMADCQRYYQKIGNTMATIVSPGGIVGFFWTHSYNTAMRATPTIVLSAQSYNNASGLAAAPDITVATFNAATIASGWASASAAFTASAEL